MLIAIHNRPAIRALSPALERELDLAFSNISKTFTKEHTDQGAHTSAGFQIPVAVQTQLDSLQSQIASIRQSAWSYKQVTGETLRGNGLAIDPELQFSMAANTVYSIKAIIHFRIDLASSGNSFKHEWTGPAGASIVQGTMRQGGTSYSERYLSAFDSSAHDLFPFDTTLAAGAAGLGELRLLVVNGANSGTFGLTWGSGSVVNNTATVKRGSILEYFAL